MLYCGLVLLMMISWFVFFNDVKIVFLFRGDRLWGFSILVLMFFFESFVVVLSVVFICLLIVNSVILLFLCLMFVFLSGIV